MKTKIIRAVIIIVILAIEIFCIGYFIYETFIMKKGFMETYRCLLPAVAFGVYFARLFTANRTKQKSLGFYENFYLNDIGDAFKDSVSDRKKLLIALRLYNQDDAKKSINMLKKLLKKCKTDEEFKVVFLFIARNYDDQGLYNMALAYYKKILEIDSTDKSANNNIGTIYMAVKNYDKAIEYFNNAVRFSPDYVCGYNNLSSVYVRIGEFDKAIEYAQRALAIDPNYLLSIKNLAVCYGVVNDTENMEMYIKKAVDLGADKEQIEKAIDYYLDLFIDDDCD